MKAKIKITSPTTQLSFFFLENRRLSVPIYSVRKFNSRILKGTTFKSVNSLFDQDVEKNMAPNGSVCVSCFNTVQSYGPSQDYTHPDDHNLPTYLDMTPGSKPFT